MKIATAFKEEESKGAIFKSGEVYVAFGAQGVTFADANDYGMESVWCLPNGTTDKFYCVLAAISDPKGDKTLLYKVWKSVSKATFTEDESLDTTLGAADCSGTYTGDTVGGDSYCALTDKISLDINTDEKSFLDATSFTIPVMIKDTSITSETFATFEEGITKAFDGFWGAT